MGPGVPCPAECDTDLIAWLARGRAQGFLGPMPIVEQVRHACAMATAVPEMPRRVVDLGSGGGVPALVLARSVWPEARWHFIEANARRAAFLNEACDALGMADRVDVWRARAEQAGREEELRHSADTVVARSFGPPAVTAECAVGFLQARGAVLVSEPPGGRNDERWPADGLARVQLHVEFWQAEPVHVVVLRADAICDEKFPRRVGVPAKRPLF